MSFFKVNRSLVDEDTKEAEIVSSKLVYVIAGNGKGKLVRIIHKTSAGFSLPNDYEYDIIY